MDVNIVIVAAAAALLGGLLYFEKRDSLAGKLSTKPFVSLLFVAAALVQPHSDAGYTRFMLSGFVLCIGGDVFLAIPGQKSFRLGLVSFLLGHVGYTVAFLQLARMDWRVGIAGAVIAVVGWRVYRWLSPHLGPMRIPVVLYIVVISVMLCSAFALAATPGVGATGKAFTLTGAFLFYLSDLFVARQRFVAAEFFNRLVGLPLYYTGQFLLAFSVGWI